MIHLAGYTKEQNPYRIYSSTLLNKLVRDGGYRLVGLYFALLDCLDQDPPVQDLEEIIAYLDIKPDEFKRLFGQLKSCGLLVECSNGFELRPPAFTGVTREGKAKPVKLLTKADSPKSGDPAVDHFLSLDHDQQVAELSERFRQEFAGPHGELTQNECEQLIYWLGHWPPVMVLLALQESVMQNARSFRYIDRVLLNWQKNKIRTVNDVWALRQQWEEKGKGVGHGGTARKAVAGSKRLGQRPESSRWEGDEELW